ncbi:MAG: RDD family protein [Chitinophagaceae bacterium]|nr:RDD family protein [Chitinophagaceae bacterium]
MENLTQQPNEAEQKDLLEDVVDPLYQYEYATQWQRFFNWLIDNLLMRFGLSYLTGMLIGVIIAAISEDFLYEAYSGQNSGGLYFILFLIGYLNYVLYYTLCEKLFKGYTLGKIITGTRAIRQDGGELTFKNALLRSLSRLVPFEVFSGFNTLTWHDSWTDTMVIKAR